MPNSDSKLVATLTFTALLFLEAGCGGSTASPTSSANMNGSWKITGISQKYPGTQGSGTASLNQSGNTITGTYNTTGGCANTSAVTGTISGRNLAIQFDENGQMASLTGTVNSTFTTASGNFTSPSGGCLNGDYGTWTAVKN